jgi:hypothetical protein
VEPDTVNARPQKTPPRPVWQEPTTGVVLHDQEAVELTAWERDQAVLAARSAVEKVKRTIASTRDSKGRIRRAKFIAAVLALRMELPPGQNEPADIAKILGCSPAVVGRALQQIRADATISAQLDRLDQIAMPLAVDNVIKGIIAGDKAYTMKLMDGRGLFRVHKSIEAQVTQTVLTFTVSMKMPPHLEGQPVPQPKPGSVVGASILAAGHTALPLPAPKS